jgi:hypothetical protein
MTPWLLGSLSLSRAHAEIVKTSATIGYLRGSDQLVKNASFLQSLDGATPDLAATVDRIRREIGTVEPPEIVPAEYLVEGNRAFARQSPTLWIHGLLPPPKTWQSVPRSVTVIVTFPLRWELEEREPDDQDMPEISFDKIGDPLDLPTGVIAWRYQSEPVVSEGTPNAFSFPVGAKRPLRLAIQVDEGHSKGGTDGPGGVGHAVESVIATLWIAPMPGVAKLTSGTYFVPLDRSKDDRLPLMATEDYLIPDDFPCLAFSVLEQPVEDG